MRLKSFFEAYLKYAAVLTGACVVLGLIIGAVSDMSVMQSVYVTFFGAGILCLFYASLMFIGTPKRRFEFYTKLSFDSDNAKRSEGRAFELFGVLPAALGITAIVFGFILEALK